MKRIGVWLWNEKQKAEIWIMRLRRHSTVRPCLTVKLFGFRRLRLPCYVDLEDAPHEGRRSLQNILVRTGRRITAKRIHE